MTVANPRRSLVTSYLEGVSWRVFEEYPGLVRDLIRGESGVYALYKDDRIYYVGLTQDLRRRLKRHLADRHQGAWDRFSVYVTRNDKDMRELEALLIRIVSPQGNRQVGRFAKSKDMGSHLVAAMKEADADKRARLLGGAARRQRRRRKSLGKKGANALAGLVSRSRRLRGECKGWVYTATLRPDGQIRYDGELYGSPTAAATAAVERRKGGWKFWHYRDPKNGWVPLANLRR